MTKITPLSYHIANAAFETFALRKASIISTGPSPLVIDPHFEDVAVVRLKGEFKG